MKPNHKIRTLIAALLLSGVATGLCQPIQFTKLTTGPIAQDRITARGLSWGDYDNDGHLDLLVATGGFWRDTKTLLNVLYHNQGNGTFARVTNGPVATDLGSFESGAWADFDNDGWLDLFVADANRWYRGLASPVNHLLYHGIGGGQFEKITNDPVVTNLVVGWNTTWGDFNNDGQVDLFVMGAWSAKGFKNSLFFNNGTGGFTKQLTGPVANDLADAEYAGASDIDNDGDLDLLVSAKNVRLFYKNQGDGTFTRITAGPIVADIGTAAGFDWGDYDNDGDIDLCLATYFGTLHLFNNDGKGNFTRLPLGQPSNYHVPTWVDYDNDGWLDLFVTNGGDLGEQRDRMFRNNGNGTFTEVQLGAVTTDGGRTIACAWADYNNDGFADLVVGNSYQLNGGMFIYQNNGNSNHWLTVRLIGTTSNRSAIGAKVRVLAGIAGESFWQLREISGGCSGSQADPRALFGLGDATNAELIRIDWPSGVVQELRDVAARQVLAVQESNADIFPAQADVSLGRALSLSVTNVPPDSALQWRFNGVDIAGATNATLEFSNATTNLNGHYTVVVSNATGSVFPRPAVVRVFDRPVITSQPSSTNVLVGSNVTLSVSALSPLPISYQWQLDALDLPGQTGSTLAVTNVQFANDGLYTVVATDALGSVTSEPAAVRVLVKPVIVQGPISQSVAAGGSVTFSVEITGNPAPFLYQWRQGSAVVTNMVLSEKKAFLTLENVRTNQAGLYRVVITNAAAPTLAVNATWNLTVLPDTDGDGLPDAWETAHGLSAVDAADAALDGDGDGQSNLGEYRAGTSPTDATSCLKLEGVTHANGQATVSFNAVSNQTYTVEWCADRGGAWTKLTDVIARPGNRTETVTDGSASDPARFYRVLTPRRQ